MKLEDLTDESMNILGVGSMHTMPVGFTVGWVHVHKISSFDENHIFMLILDDLSFASWVPIILGTSVLGQTLNVIKESELNDLSIPWAQTRLTVGLGGADR